MWTCSARWSGNLTNVMTRRARGWKAEPGWSPRPLRNWALRVSLRAYNATFEDALAGLTEVTTRAEFIPDDVRATDLPACTPAQSTDAHLVVLARRRQLRMGTLDEGLLKQTWAKGVAEKPLE